MQFKRHSTEQRSKQRVKINTAEVITRAVERGVTLVNIDPEGRITGLGEVAVLPTGSFVPFRCQLTTSVSASWAFNRYLYNRCVPRYPPRRRCVGISDLRLLRRDECAGKADSAAPWPPASIPVRRRLSKWDCLSSRFLRWVALFLFTPTTSLLNSAPESSRDAYRNYPHACMVINVSDLFFESIPCGRWPSIKLRGVRSPEVGIGIS